MNNQGIMDDIIKAAQQAVADVESELVNEDGLRLCRKCGTPVQCRVNILGMEKVVPCLCKCGKEQRAADEQAAKRQTSQRLVRDRRNEGFADDEMKTWTFDKDDGGNPELSRTAKAYVENFHDMLAQGKGLLLFGTVGTGKTFMGACIVNAVIDRGYTALATNFGRIVNAVNGNYETRQDTYDTINGYDLLMIDDLAAERDTEYMNEIVFNVIDGRARVKKPLIVTTNLTADELKNTSDTRKQRIYSRLFELCIPIEVSGKDRRRKALQEDYQKLKGVLDL